MFHRLDRVSVFKFLLHLISKSTPEAGSSEEYDLATEPSAPSWGGLHEAKVARVIDGDTVDVIIANGELLRVRLECIDCPEDGQPWGDEATKGLISLIGPSQRRHIYLEVRDLDIHERVLATIYVMIDSELVNVNERMVMLGHAWSTIHIHKQLTPKRNRQLMLLQRWARSKKRGLWATENPTPPWEWRSNKTGQGVIVEPSFEEVSSKTSALELAGASSIDTLEKFVVRRNKASNKLFIEFDDKTLISPEGRDIELDTERFSEPEEVFSSVLTKKQLAVYQNKIKGDEFELAETKKVKKLQSQLFEELRKTRMKIAMSKGVPAYVIFEDKTLIEMSEIMPESQMMMLQVWGVGPDKLVMYGDHFIKVVKKFKSDFNLDSKNDTA